MLHADQITIATGGRPSIPSEDTIPGASLGIDSDGFFELEEQPKRVVVVGAGYIAVELAGVLHTLGSETHLLIRHDKVLRSFDPVIQDTITPWMEKTGINIHKQTNVVKVEGEKGKTLTVYTDKGDKIEADVLLWAIGRHANTEGMGLEEIGVKLDKKGDVVVDEYQNTNVKGITSIGDVQGKALLTPVAIAAGRKLSNRLFGPEKFKNDKLDYTNIPTVVFS
jgi:glutathione reductase (NADPH)